MASAMDSTIPPTIPTSLAASFSVTIMSSTASFMSCAASAMASWVWAAYEVVTQAPVEIVKYPTWDFSDHDRWGKHEMEHNNKKIKKCSCLWVSSTLLCSIEHLQGRLSQGLGLVQESHLLLVVTELGGDTHGCSDERFKVTRQLGNLIRKNTRKYRPSVKRRLSYAGNKKYFSQVYYKLLTELLNLSNIKQ